MKKTLLISLFAMFVVAIANAEVKFGVRGGYNISKFSFDENILTTSNQKGFYMGPTLKLGTPIIDIDMSALYNRDECDANDVKVKKQDFDLQLNIRRGIGLGDNASVYGFIGPQFGFNIGDKGIEIKDAQNNIKEWKWRDSDFSINVGVGIMLLNHFEIRANYNVACGKSADINVWDETEKVFKNLTSPKNNTWQIGAAIYF